MKNPYTNHEHGSALITALFIMALVAILAVGLHQKLSSSMHRTESLTQLVQFENLNNGIIAWAEDILSENILPKHWPVKIHLSPENAVSVTGVLDSIEINSKNKLPEAWSNLLLTLFPELSSTINNNQQYFLLISYAFDYNRYTILKRSHNNNTTHIQIIGSF